MKQHKAAFRRHLWWVLIVSVVMIGCQPAPAPSAPAEKPHPTSVNETRTPFPTWTPTATALPATPWPTRAATATPQPAATATPFPVCAPVWQRPLPKTEPLHDLILFTSTTHAPFAPEEIRQRTTPTHLWAIAADGRRGERLAATDDMLFIRPDNGARIAVDLLATQPYSLETDFVHQHTLLPECEDGSCAGYQFSPNGTWAVYFWGEEACGRGVAALDLRTDETRILTATGGYNFTFISEETLLLATLVTGTTHCESGNIAMIDLPTGEQTILGATGSIRWNPQQTAFAVSTLTYTEWRSAVWGYDAAQGRHFLPLATEPDTDESATEAMHPLWTPAGDHLLYQQRAISYTLPAKVEFTLGPQQIVVVDAATGEQQVLLSDPAYDYHLCTAYEVCPWEGDFIEIRRISYRQSTFSLKANTVSAAINCALYGFRCADPVERFALNWRTGELVPWDARPAAEAVPTSTPTHTPAATAPQPAAPDLTGPAFYTATDGTYTLHLGGDDRSLWCVPAGGEPVLWVNTGANFTYVP
ncbi:MAG: hypothetical protein ACP5J4_08460 [Anaerolineae bacterium]